MGCWTHNRLKPSAGGEIPAVEAREAALVVAPADGAAALAVPAVVEFVVASAVAGVPVAQVVDRLAAQVEASADSGWADSVVVLVWVDSDSVAPAAVQVVAPAAVLVEATAAALGVVTAADMVVALGADTAAGMESVVP
jgi:hypothetical protein